VSEESLSFNGIDGSTGSYLTPPLSAAQVAALAQGEPIDKNHLAELKARVQRDTEERLFIDDVEPADLASSGWGVIFAHNAPPEIREALHPLLEHRKVRAAGVKEHRYKEYLREKGYRVGDPKESKRTFLARGGAGAGMPADPDKVPCYLLLVGDPETIPYKFQSQLDVEYAVGRLWFETADGKPDLEAFTRYAQSVIDAETGKVIRPRRAAFIGVGNEDDFATTLSADHLVHPLAEALTRERSAWTTNVSVRNGAHKADLAGLLNGPDVPALLFTASHGMGFPNGDVRQLPHQGALLCQDWPGPRVWGGRPIPPDHYLAADDVGDSAHLSGLIAVHFACFGAGTPRLDDFPHLKQLPQRTALAPRAFVARLPQRLLGHPNGGALAVVGHVERAWSCSFHGGPRLGEQLQVFRDAMLRLLDGLPVGCAMEPFNALHASLGAELNSALEDIKYGATPDDRALSSLWTANNDARSYLVFGDPAVRLPLAAGHS
jgi:hypothetical protein